MFTTGRIIFIAFFIIAFVILMIVSYKKDAKNHQSYYKNTAKKVTIYGTIAIVIFLGLRFLTAYFF